MATVISLTFWISLMAVVSSLVYTSPVIRSMEEYQIVPDVIDKAPQFEIQVESSEMLDLFSKMKIIVISGLMHRFCIPAVPGWIWEIYWAQLKWTQYPT